MLHIIAKPLDGSPKQTKHVVNTAVLAKVALQAPPVATHNCDTPPSRFGPWFFYSGAESA